MPVRVKFLPLWIDNGDTEFLQHVLEFLQGQVYTLAQAVHVAGGVRRRQAQLHAVQHRQQLGNEFIQGVLVGVFYVAGGALAQVLHLRVGTHGLVQIQPGLVTGGLQFLLQLLQPG